LHKEDKDERQKIFGLEKDRKIRRGVQESMRELSQVKA